MCITFGKPKPSREAWDDYCRKQVGTISRTAIPFQQVIADLKELGLTWMDSDIPDYNVYYTDEVTLTKMIPFLTFPMGDASEYDIDCDDYSMWAASDARRIFKVNGIFQVWGTMPLGFHAFSLGLIAPKQYKLWEPNAGFIEAGELFDTGDHDYKPEKWK